MAEYVVEEPSGSSASWRVHERIVRCRGCKHFVTNIHGSYCKKSIATTSDPNGFCAWATRKENK